MFSLPCAYATPAADSLGQFVAERFDFGPVTACRLLNRGFNDMFVVEAGIRKAMLRLSRTGRRRPSDLEYEAALLSHLHDRSVAVAKPYRGLDGGYCQHALGAEGARLALLFAFVSGRGPQESPADMQGQGVTLARVHNEAASFAAEHDRFRLDLDHLLSRPLVRLDQILDARPTDRKYLARLSERLRRQVGERAAELSQCVCHGDCHGFNAVIDGDGSATLVDFDDGGPGWVAYDLCVFLWSARAFAPQRRGLWLHFLDGYRSVRPIARADLDAVSLFVPLRHIWLLGEYAAGAGGWGSWWLGEWFNRQIAFLRAWEQERLSDPSACISRWTSRRSRESAVFREEHMPETASERLARFDPLVTEVMAEWRIPGLAMAVLRRYEPPALQCWGVCDIDTGAPVTTDTVFPICAVTKSFTATALALLVDEGKLEWDRPVREYLPEFRLRNPVATDQATLRDLLTHRTGLPRHTWVYMAGHLDNAGMFEALRYLEPSRPFRSAYQYSNLSPGWCSSASAANTGKILFGPGSWRRSAWSGPRLRSKTCSRSTRIARCRI